MSVDLVKINVCHVLVLCTQYCTPFLRLKRSIIGIPYVDVGETECALNQWAKATEVQGLGT